MVEIGDPSKGTYKALSDMPSNRMYRGRISRIILCIVLIIYLSFQIFLALLMPPFIFTLEFKTVEELQLMPQTLEEHMNDASISSTEGYVTSEVENRLILNFTGSSKP